MKWVVIVVRTLVGVGFAFSGLVGFVPLVPMEPPPGMDPSALKFGELLSSSGYMYAVKALELTGGLLLASGRLAPLGITLLMPVAVNILLFEAFLAKQPGPGVVLVALLIFLIWAYRSSFRSVFTTNARIG